MTATVTKKSTELYQVRDKHTWGDISITVGETSVQVMANSDYGNYAYYWGSTGPNPKEFLTRIDMHYAMNKLTSGNMYEPDLSKYDDEVKTQIINARREGDLTTKQAREAWDDMLRIVDDLSGSDAMYLELMEHELYGLVFGDIACLPHAEKVRPQRIGFWEKIWTPFVEQLKVELKSDKSIKVKAEKPI